MAGVAALMKAINPELTPALLDTLLENGQLTEDIGNAGRDNQFGYGLINAQLAVDAAGGGNTAPSEPKLGLAPNGLNFGVRISSLSLNIFNAGAGQLSVDSVLSSEPWLTVQKVSGDGSGLGNYAIEVNRSELSEGVHSATITINASTGVSIVPVLLRVGGESVSDAGLNYYLLINAATSAIVQTVAYPVQGVYQLNFAQVPKGDYFLLGGTDMDNDDVICEEGELCGGYPSVEQLLPINISEDVGNLQFIANFSQSLQIVSNSMALSKSKLIAKISKPISMTRVKGQKSLGFKLINSK